MVALVQDGCGMPGGEEAVPEVAEDVEGDQVPQAAVGVEGVLDAEDQEAGLGPPQVRQTCGERRSSGVHEFFGFSRKRVQRSLRRRDVGWAIEEAAVRPPAERVETQEEVPEEFRGIEVLALRSRQAAYSSSRRA